MAYCRYSLHPIHEAQHQMMSAKSQQEEAFAKSMNAPGFEDGKQSLMVN